MIERVAAAIMQANFSRPVEIQGINVSVPDTEDLARAAIEAMREPNAIMLLEAITRNRIIDCDEPRESEMSKAGWQIMINAALKE